MEIHDIAKLYATLPQIGALRHVLENKSKGDVFLQGLVGSALPTIFASLSEKRGRKSPFLLILNDADEAGYCFNDLNQMLKSDDVMFFPSSFRRAAKYGQRDAANEILRTEVLAKLSSAPSSFIIVTHPEALAELVVSKQAVDEQIVKLATGQTADIVELEHRLRELSFQEVDYVYEPGQFAVRGSILDIYSYSCELPYRIDFFGDEIDSIRTFEVQDQLSKERCETAEIAPELSKMQSAKVPFFDFLPAETILVGHDFDYVRETVGRIYDEGFSTQAMTDRLEGLNEVERKEVMREMQREMQLLTASQFEQSVAQFRHVVLLAASKTAESGSTIHFNTSQQPLFHKNIDLLKTSLADFQLQGYRLYILADSQKQHQRLRELLDTEFISVNKTLHEGFIDHDLKACFFTDHQIFDRFHKFTLKSENARQGKMALTMKELQEMEIGDYLVHVDYGIGQFGGLMRIDKQEVIRMIFLHNDKVDVSIHSLYKISKYRRSDTGEPPRLSLLGSGAWERLKERTKKRIKDIARDLIKLYARRQKEKGFAYSPDSYLQHELEASFLYEDTPDQLRATQEVKADMEAAKPMDRLICGDVGFGKTEVAIRAAFKAASDSKQVAVLVPTTVLSFQHFQTFRDRLKDLPVRVEYLSRARSTKQTNEILADLKEGKIDILIGTHKLIGKQVVWKDLGLLIIDEEQKFGVSVKEKLRQMKASVDTLTMSATPIPRTLQFSLMGARDMSIIRTPPPNRYPIYTELGSYKGEYIAEAIRFEMSRNGQVFFVNNRISKLEEIRRLILNYVPDCRIAIGHGQMKPEELEKIIMGFINYDYDVLLSTTIVENGIDIPNANTIIINDAHHFGLSDLHQMRGRVGRSNRKAFCYLLAPPKSVLTPEARRRLEALETFSELGSGFNLAMQDLDIRGAGNLLGAEQSGFLEDLGYETYLKIIRQAMAELRNEAPADEKSEVKDEGNSSFMPHPSSAYVADCTFESDLEMYFPETYVPGSQERMILYRELDSIENDQLLDAYRQRLVDRFGPIPHEGEELLHVVAIRRIGKRLGCEKITLRQGKMVFHFVSNAESPYYQSEIFGKILNYVSFHPQRCLIKEVNNRRLMHISDVPTTENAVRILREIEN
ncbi:MAG: transcription-repair coupling factor [Prevotella sp.]|nr:transcription-repair coupling factor [Prevotella sp.]